MVNAMCDTEARAAAADEGYSPAREPANGSAPAQSVPTEPELIKLATPFKGAEVPVTGTCGPGDASGLESYLSHTVRTQLTIITLLSTNLDLLYDRLDDEKRKKMIRELREQTRLLNGLVVNALEMLQGADG